MTISSTQFHTVAKSVLPHLRKYIIESGASPDFIGTALHEDSFATPSQDELNAATDPRTLFLQKLVGWLPNAASSSTKLEGLNPVQLKTLLLVDGCDCSYGEVVRVCECKVGTVKSRLYRARDILNPSRPKRALRKRSI